MTFVYRILSFMEFATLDGSTFIVHLEKNGQENPRIK